MSIGIATMGMFRPCCGTTIAGGGGAPPYRQNYEEETAPIIRVLKVESKTISKSSFPDNLKVKLRDE